MAEIIAPYEVEIRCRFDTAEEAYAALPFLRSCLGHDVSWTSSIYGLALFKRGEQIRIAGPNEQGNIRKYLGWKGTDIGEFANIRKEIDEEITSGIENSVIMKMLGSEKNFRTIGELAQELERLGYGEFMSFSGRDLSGYETRYGLQVKLMLCRDIKWPVLVELEKAAESEAEAFRCEKALRDVCNEFQLQDRLVKEEPPTLLYQRVFGGKS